MLNRYRTIKENGIHEIVIRKSRFICHLKRTESEEDALAFIDAIKKEHWKATHNCSAYLIGERNEIQRAHDDGEPSGTAGVPMLEVLKKNELKDVTAVVTRYFGGIKLGAGGLIRAYSGSVSEALKEIGIVERRLQQEIRLTVAYPLSGKLENSLRESEYTLKDTEYTDKVTFVCLVDEEDINRFKDETTDWLSAQGEYALGEKRYTEYPLPS